MKDELGHRRIGRRTLLKAFSIIGTGLAAGMFRRNSLSAGSSNYSTSTSKIPIIDITDLYHPYQDPGDNFDLIAAYGLPEVDLRAVILDVTDEYRKPGDPRQKPEYRDETGPRDPGIIPVMQLNYIFDRNVPFGIAPFTRMKSPDDKMLDVPKFQQHGIELILKVLKESEQKVEILSFGSARALAAAYNREPNLMREKVRKIHLSAGSSSPEFLEWNVMLDPKAIVCLLSSDLPIAIYPCGTGKGAFDLGPNNSYYLLENLNFISQMDSKLQRYAAYSFERLTRPDFINFLEEDLPLEVLNRICSRRHNVWETALWAQVSRRKLVQRADGTHRLIPQAEIKPGDIVLPNNLVSCKIKVRDDGIFTFEKTKEKSNFEIYERGDPEINQKAMREALAALYISFSPSLSPKK